MASTAPNNISKCMKCSMFGMVIGLMIILPSLIHAKRKYKKTKKLLKKRDDKILKLLRKNSNADDNCNSLFYDTQPNDDGSGFPNINTCSIETINKLVTIQPEYKRLESKLYKSLVENMVVVCIDIVCQRKKDGKILLFYRRDPPASKTWW
jgi:hypothetical protein